MNRQEFLKSQLGITDIDWSFPLEVNTNNYSNIIDELLNDIAFSLLSKKDKKVFYNLIEDSLLNEKGAIVRDIYVYLDEHYSSLNKRYPNKAKLTEKLVDKMYEWIFILDQKISPKLINRLVVKIQTKNQYFWFIFVKKLYTEEKYKEANLLVNLILHFFTKDDDLYEDVILYKLSSIKNMNYIYKDKLQEELFDLSTKLKNYPSTVLMTQLEYFTLKGNQEKFNKLIDEYSECIEEYQIYELLNVYELSIVCSANIAQLKILDLLLISDIFDYYDKEEYEIYSLLNAIHSKKIAIIKRQIKKLKDVYNFDHIKWFYRNNEKMLKMIKSNLEKKLK